MLPNLPQRALRWLPFAIALPKSHHTTADHTGDIVAIGQTISLFPILIDTWRYDALDHVFTPNASADFAAPGIPVMHGLPPIIELLRTLQGSSSQHAMTTQHIEMTGLRTANATTYLTGHFFDDRDEEAPN